MRIAVVGNIGSGKTTLTKLLAKHYGWDAYFEAAEENPYINSFYEDMQRWSFNLQVFFLNSRLKKIIEFQKSGNSVIHDRTIYEDAEIFAPNLQEMGLITSRDFETYKSLYETIRSLIKPPDLLIYLKASVPTLVRFIQKRGREYENSIRLDYLSKLNERYEDWITGYNYSKVITVDVEKNNFADKPEDLGKVINKIEGVVNSLFNQNSKSITGKKHYMHKP